MINSAQAKLDWILSRIRDGYTVHIHTPYVQVPVSARTITKWEAAGRPLFKLVGNNLFVGRGSRYDCIDYCKLVATK